MTWLERQWQRRTAGALLLYPLSLMFGAVAAARRGLFRRGIFPRHRLQVPVIVVGNIAVGGTGKTPLVLWLCAWLETHGRRPGIITRGYGGRSREPQRVQADSDPARCGDEAVLLAARSGRPVWSGADRPAAGRALLAAHPECDVIVCDDGLQHYALERDVEIVVVDAVRGHGNGWLLPAGPLREMPQRLNTVDAVVTNGESSLTGHPRTPSFRMRLAGRTFRNVLNPQLRTAPEALARLSVHAVAGIGHPERFFEHLRSLGLDFVAHPFPDHYPYRAHELAYADAEAIVMTEKDAVKCQRFASERFWTLPVDAEVDPELGALTLRKLERR